MVYNLGVLMNPIESIDPMDDSTLPILCEAQKRGWHVHYLTKHDLFLENNIVYGNMKRLSVSKDHHHWFDYQDTAKAPIKTLDVLLMRQDPPVDLHYIYLTYLLERAEKEGVLVVNRPSSLRNLNEKLFASSFVNFSPETLVTANIQQLKAFVQSVGKAVIKPLHVMGGQSIFLLNKDDKNCNVILETMTQHGETLVLIQKYIDAVAKGDRRILLLEGEAIPYAIVRVATHADFRCNIFSGAKVKFEPLSNHDKKICKTIGPILKKEGLLFVGIDVIGHYLTEINMTSPGCLTKLETFASINLSSQLLDIIERQLKSRKKSQV
jgi:glutathione synthase